MTLKRLLLPGLWLAVAVLIALVVALPAAAQDDADEPTECSLATLQGTYGVLLEGTMLYEPIPVPLTLPYHFVITGTVTFDGNGNVSTISRQSFGGLIFSSMGRGTYNVNPDCTTSTAFHHFGGISHRVGVITGKGMQQEMHMMFADAYWIAHGTLKKAPVGSCSLATLKGTYGLFGNGTTPPMDAPLLATKVGIVTFDGAGNFSARDTTNTNGVIVPDAEFTGTYTVESDCRASTTIHTDDGDIDEAGVITGEGRFKEFRGIFTKAGWAFAQTLKKR